MSDLTRRSFLVFKRAIEVDASTRSAFVRDACGDDSQLRRRVETLVAAVGRTEGFLETPAARGVSATAVPRDRLAPGDAVAGYQVVSVIGVGGMGTVYEAMQERPRRRVALKVMQRGVATAEGRRRFEFEAEILARLRHPGIAQIFEAGTHGDGAASVPWFAMEYIPEAQAITEYVGSRTLGLRATLALCVAVCDAVQHGHQKGVIHRDLKPGNILVDTKEQPKVIDFGIARLTDPARAGMTRQTSFGQLIGTLNYMSPEQCGADASDLDVRADVYSLGIVLYELLCGRLPHDLDEVPIVEALRIIQTESPPHPAALDGALRGDVEAIVLKAIAKDRERRYPSAGALGRDLQRYLGNEMIEARPLTLFYQLQLFARRNRRFIAGLILVAFTIVAAVVASVSFAVWAGAEASRRHAAELAAIDDRDAARWNAYLANVGAAFFAHQAGEFRPMRVRLRKAPASLRGWEWRLLRALAEPSESQFVAHEDMVFALAMTSDGRRLATASRDSTMCVWDSETHALIATGVGHDGWVHDVAFSPDGRRVVTSSEDATVRVWNASTGEEEFVFHEHQSGVTGVDWSPRGEIASASADGVVWVWDGRTGAALEQLRTVDRGKSSVSFSTDGRWLATWGAGSTLTLRDTATRAVGPVFTTAGTIRAVAWSDDDRQIAATADDATHVWDVATREIRHVLPPEVSTPRSVAFFPGGRRLAVGIGRAIVQWELAADERETRLLGHEEQVSGICVSPDGRRLYSTSWDRTLRVWDPDSEGPIRVLRGHEDAVIATVFSPDGTTVASASLDGTVRIWAARGAAPVQVLSAAGNRALALSFAPDGAVLASASHDRSVRLWEVSTGRVVATLAGHRAAIGALAFAPNGRLLASGSRDKTIRLWDVDSRTINTVLEGHDARINGLAFSPDGRLLASASRDATVRVWDVMTGAQVQELSGHASDVFAVVFSHDGRRLYSGARDQTVRVWDPATGACVDVLDGHGQFVTSLALSPDGTRLAAGSWFKKIVLWDLATGDEVATLTGHGDVVRSVAFGPSGDRLASGSYDGTVRIWDGAPRQREP